MSDYKFVDTQLLDAANENVLYYQDFNHLDPNTKYPIAVIPDFIRRKAFGIDVREILAQALERMYEDFSKEGNSNYEVSMARGTYETLADRLNNELISMDKLSSDVKLAMTGGAVPVVGINSTGYENVKFQSLNEDKIDFVQVSSNNLVDISKITEGKRIDGLGTVISDSNYKLSTFIPVDPGMKYYRESTQTVSFYDVTYKWLSNSNDQIFTVPGNARYVRIAFLSSNSKPYLFKGELSKLADNYALSIPKLKIIPENVDMVLKTTENLFNKEILTQTGGYLDATGSFVTNTQYGVSDFIPVEQWVYYSQTNGSFVNFYDSNKQRVNYIASSGGSNGNFLVPQNLGIKYIKINVYLNQLDTTMLVKGNKCPSVYIPYYKKDLDSSKYNLNNYVKSALYGKKWNAAGDSITARGFGYHSQIHQVVGDMTVRNYGISGRGLMTNGDDITYPPLVDDYINMDNDADYVTVFIGTNDFNNQKILGTINSSKDKTTFYGALKVLCEGLIDKYQGKKIAFFTPIPRNFGNEGNLAIPLVNYVNAIIEVCGLYSIPVLDLYRKSNLYPTNSNIKTNYFENADGLHPNYEGHKILMNKIKNFMEGL